LDFCLFYVSLISVYCTDTRLSFMCYNIHHIFHGVLLCKTPRWPREILCHSCCTCHLLF